MLKINFYTLLVGLFLFFFPIKSKAENVYDVLNNSSTIDVIGSNLSLTRGEESFTPAMEDSVNFLNKYSYFINVSLSDISKNFSALQINGGPRRLAQSFTMRGFDKSGVLVLLDDLPVEFLSQHINFLPLSLMPVSNVKVIRGSFSSLYGTNALGGLVSLKTANPQELLLPNQKEGMSVSSSYSTVNNSINVMGNAYSKRNKADFLGSISYMESKDIKSGNKNEIAIPERNKEVSGLLKSNILLPENNTINIAYYFNLNDVTLPSNPEQNDNANSFVRNIDHNIDFQSHTLKLGHEYKNNEKLLSNLSTVSFFNYGKQDEKATQNFPAPPNTKPFYTKGQNLGKNNYNWGIFHKENLNIDINSNFSSSFIYGIDYKSQQQKRHDTDPRGLVANAKSNNIALFLQDEMFLNKYFTVLGALRYDYFNIQHTGEYDFKYPNLEGDLIKRKIYNQISPKLSLTYKPSTYFMMYSSYGRAFKTPNLNEMFSSGVHFMVGPYTNALLPNPNLKPTISDTIEVGYGVNINSLPDGGEVSFKNAFYYTVAKDFITLNVTKTTSQYVNVSKVKIGGIDLSFNYTNKYGSSIITYNYINTIDTHTGKELVNISAHTFKYNTEAKVPNSKLFIGYGIKAQSPFKINNAPTIANSSKQQRMPGFTVFDLYAGFASERYKVSFNIDNILDKFYYDTFSGLPNSGRNYRIFFTMKF